MTADLAAASYRLTESIDRSLLRGLARRDRRDHPPLELAFPLAHDLERRDQARQLSGLEQVLGARGLAARALPCRVRLVQEPAPLADRARQDGEQRPVQVAHDEDDVVDLVAEVG